MVGAGGLAGAATTSGAELGTFTSALGVDLVDAEREGGGGTGGAIFTTGGGADFVGTEGAGSVGSWVGGSVGGSAGGLFVDSSSESSST